MKPLQLKLEGFSCYKSFTEINFEGLELFAISGPTGAGKSTLLDAITYALYGETNRLGAKVGEALFSPEVQKMSVQLTFQVKNQAYRATRVAERRSGKVKNETRIEFLHKDGAWKQLPESEKQKEAAAKLAEIVGLSAENFTRAVLLPQGAFDRFLHASTAQRTELLSGLLGLDVTEEMKRLAGERFRDALARERSIEERLQQDYKDATPERRRELNTALQEVKGVQQDLQARRQALSDALDKLRQVRALWQERQDLQAKLSELAHKGPQMAAQREKLARAAQADLLLPELETLKAQEARARAVQQERLEAEAVSEAAAAKLKEAGAAEAAAVARLSALPAMRQQAEALLEVRPLYAQLRQLRGTLALADEAQEGVRYSDAAWSEVQLKRARVSALRQAAREVTVAEKRLGDAQEGVNTLKERLVSVAETLDTLVLQGKAARLEQQEKDASYSKAVTENQAAALREHLHEGDTCPVCAQVIRSLPEKTALDLEKLKAAAQGATKLVNSLEADYKAHRATQKNLEERLIQDEAALQGLSREVEARRSQLGDVVAELGGDDAEALQRGFDKAERGLLAALAKAVSAKSGGLEPTQALSDLKAKIAQVEAQGEAARAALQDAERAAERSTLNLRHLQERQQDAAATLGTLGTRFAENLGSSPFENAAEVAQAALPKAQQERLQGELERFARDQEKAQERDVKLEAALAGERFDPEAFAAQQQQQQDLESQLSEAQRLEGQLESQLGALEKMLETSKTLRAEQKALAELSGVYRTLDLHLRNDRFPNYLLRQVQQELAARASHILRDVTEHRYDLLFADNEYQVLDAWSGEVRRARTLSGGESFITSLALALALSDTIAGSTSLDALFLDEGFGTLDAETLEAVSKVLESLTANGRMVGVITHVAALTERLPDRLLVSKEQSGSKVAWDL